MFGINPSQSVSIGNYRYENVKKVLLRVTHYSLLFRTITHCSQSFLINYHQFYFSKFSIQKINCISQSLLYDTTQELNYA